MNRAPVSLKCPAGGRAGILIKPRCREHRKPARAGVGPYDVFAVGFEIRSESLCEAPHRSALSITDQSRQLPNALAMSRRRTGGRGR
jgi:hypothetical protein